MGLRLIDADALKARIMTDAPDFLDGGSSITKAFILAMLGTRNATPTIDAVPVVRCGECVHSCDYTDIYPDRAYKCIKNGGYHNDSWFCADGERQEG